MTMLTKVNGTEKKWLRPRSPLGSQLSAFPSQIDRELIKLYFKETFFLILVTNSDIFLIKILNVHQIYVLSSKLCFQKRFFVSIFYKFVSSKIKKLFSNFKEKKKELQGRLKCTSRVAKRFDQLYFCLSFCVTFLINKFASFQWFSSSIC